MALANGTPVGVPNGQLAIETIAVGDPIMASGSPLAWAPATVAFSQGADRGGQPVTAMFLRWDGGDIIATLDHVFVLEDFTLVRASRLQPGDALLAADGAGAMLQLVSVGEFNRGIHAIATNTPWTPGSLAGRLLNTGGVVTGDFTLQMHLHQDDSPPTVGAPEHAERHETLRNL